MNEQEIQWAVDELEIRNVIASLALLSDMGDIEEWGMLFTEDADYTIRGRPSSRVGPRSWRAAASAGRGGRMARAATTDISAHRYWFAPQVQTQPRPSPTSRCTRTCPRRAMSRARESWQRWRGGEVSELLVLGYYRDRFRRTSDGWKVAHRDLAESSSTPGWRAIMESWNR